jgi:hypothetical protein
LATERTTETRQTTQGPGGPGGKLGKNKNLILLAGGAALLYVMSRGHNAAQDGTDTGDGSGTTVAGTVVPVSTPAETAGSYETGDQYSPGGYIGGDVNAPVVYPGAQVPGSSGVPAGSSVPPGAIAKIQKQNENQRKRLDNLRKHRRQDEKHIKQLQRQVRGQHGPKKKVARPHARQGRERED